jgi:stalled ribosome rescue protein Dom34
MARIGIWLDKEKAHVVTLHDNQANFETILSNVETSRDVPGSDIRLKEGSKEIIQDSKFMEREKQQLKIYFKNLVSEIKEADKLVLFGPAETEWNFKKELNSNYKEISAKLSYVVKADSMTNAQIVAWVKLYYDAN